MSSTMDIPSSEATVEVQLINTTTDIYIDSVGFIEPVIESHKRMHMPTFCFLVKHKPSNRSVLFDCGSRTNWRDLPPKLVKVIAEADITVTKSVDEILVDGGFALDDLSSIVWSHWHWDHYGDPTRFHKNTEICVGPSFKKNMMPGYPTSPDANLLDTDFENRTIREIEFSDDFRIGAFRAFDFFDDGSFFLLDVPGHAIGHMAGLARTTKDTFVMMAGDTCHFAGVFRPSTNVTLPATVPKSVTLPKRFSRPCPSSTFSCLHPKHDQASTTPFYDISKKEGGWYVDANIAQKSAGSLQEFDADGNVLVLLAHDTALEDVVEQFPHDCLNHWKAKGFKERFAWNFLGELVD